MHQYGHGNGGYHKRHSGTFRSKLLEGTRLFLDSPYEYATSQTGNSPIKIACTQRKGRCRYLPSGLFLNPLIGVQSSLIGTEKATLIPTAQGQAVVLAKPVEQSLLNAGATEEGARGFTV